MPLDVRRRERKKEGERSPQETWVEELKENSISVLPKKKRKRGVCKTQTVRFCVQ